MVSLQADVDAARAGTDRVVLEGVHALKHALRFGAVVRRIASPDPTGLAALLADLAPDVRLPAAVEAVTPATWQQVTRGGLPSPALAVADRPVDRLADVLATDDARPVVLLDRPTHLGNVGACVRVAAAADAAGLVVRGRSDPWHPRAIRGGAGLQFALPVGSVTDLPQGPRPRVAVDPGGIRLGEVAVPAGAVLAFGTERGGLNADLRDSADLAVAIPMRPGVSSLNLATAVAVLLYAEHR